MSDRALRIWIGALGALLADARDALEPDEYARFIDSLRVQLAVGTRRRGPSLTIKLAHEAPIIVYLDTVGPSEADRLRDWLHADEGYSELVDLAVSLARRERELLRAA
jgi:hypothetical protein